MEEGGEICIGIRADGHELWCYNSNLIHPEAAMPKRGAAESCRLSE